MELEQEPPPGSAQALAQVMRDIRYQEPLLWGKPGWTVIQALGPVVDSLVSALGDLETKGLAATHTDALLCDQLFQALAPLCQQASQLLASTPIEDVECGISQLHVLNKLGALNDSQVAWSEAMAAVRQAQADDAPARAERAPALPAWSAHRDFPREATRALDAAMQQIKSHEKALAGVGAWDDIAGIDAYVKMLKHSIDNFPFALCAWRMVQLLDQCQQQCIRIARLCGHAADAFRSPRVNAVHGVQVAQTAARAADELGALADALDGWSPVIKQQWQAKRREAAAQAEPAIPPWSSEPALLREGHAAILRAEENLAAYERLFGDRQEWRDVEAMLKQLRELTPHLGALPYLASAVERQQGLSACAEGCARVTSLCKAIRPSFRSGLVAGNEDADRRLGVDAFGNMLDTLAGALTGWSGAIARETALARARP